MAQQRQIVEIDCGVDYLTCTFNPSAMLTRLQIRVEKIASRETTNGNFKRPWSMSGYDGFAVGGLQCGVRDDGMIVRLSGPTAQDHWRKIGQLATNCSRIDVQVTVRPDEPVTKTLTRHWREMKRWNKTLKRPPALVQWSDVGGVGTIYSGKRQSLCYGRIYNKFLQSNLDHHRNSIRYEVEYKAELAKTVLAQLLAAESHLKVCRAHCQSLFSDRGCRLWLTNDVARRTCRMRCPSNVTSRLQWLRAAVRPTAVQLTEMGYGAEVLSALGLSESELQHGPASHQTKRVA